MTTLIEEIKEEDKNNNFDIEIDYENALSVIMDFTQPLNIRIIALEKYYEEKGDETMHVIFTLNGMYQISGSSIIQKFFYKLCTHSNVSNLLKLEASKALLEYEEFLEEVEEDDDEITKQNKIERIKSVLENDKKRKELGYKALDFVCYDLNNMSTPCRVEAIFTLMNSENYEVNTKSYFREFIRDDNIECEYKYKTILSLENINRDIIIKELIKKYEDKQFLKKFYKDNTKSILEIVGRYKNKSKKEFYKILQNLNYETVKNIYKENIGEFKNDRTLFIDVNGIATLKAIIKDAQLTFLFHQNNDIYYRILSGQYLLQKLDLDIETRNKVENELLNFATNPDIEYNRRADSTDILLNLASNEVKDKAKIIINELGMINGKTKTVFDNAQNVHTKEVEQSVIEVLEFFATLPLLQVKNQPIYYEYVYSEIMAILKERKKKMENENKSENNGFECKYCKNYTKTPYQVENNKFFSEKCYNMYKTENRVKTALNRILMDRALYSKFNNTLFNILLKIWTYISLSEFKEELQKRLIEELEDMSDTCSSGFASRLINSISGYGDFSVRISWEDQIIANFSGRLNAFARKIEKFEPDNPFYNEQSENIIKLWLDKYPYVREEYEDITIKTLNKQNVSLKEIIKVIFDEEKLRICVSEFKENVLNEMTINSSKYNLRPNFLLFFRVYMPKIKEELYKEFSSFISDNDFDLYFKRAILTYQGDF